METEWMKYWAVGSALALAVVTVACATLLFRIFKILREMRKTNTPTS
jgi:hypothetical protein